MSKLITKNPEIQGYIEIKRTRYFARKYAEIVDDCFYYFKEKGQSTPRGVYSLVGAKIIERHDKSDHYISFQVQQQSEIIHLKFKSLQEFNTWLKVITESAINSGNGAISGSGVNANSIGAGDNNDHRVIAESKPRRDSITSRSHNELGSTQMSDPTLAKPSASLPEKSYFIDSELLVNNTGDSLVQLRANLHHYKSENINNMKLVHCSDNFRVFQYQKRKKSKENNDDDNDTAKRHSGNSVLNFIKELTENIKSLGTFMQGAMIASFAIMLFMMSHAAVESLSVVKAILSVLITQNILIIGYMFSKKKALEYYNQKNREAENQMNYDISSLAITTCKHDINHIIYILKNPKLRMKWQPYVKDVTLVGELYNLIYNFQQRQYIEIFSTVTYKENDSIYIVDHHKNNILRLFEIAYFKDQSHYIIKFYSRSKVNKPNLEEILPPETPFMLQGLISYANEAIIDPESPLNFDYSKRRKTKTFIADKINLNSEHFDDDKNPVTSKSLQESETKSNQLSQDDDESQDNKDEITTNKNSFNKEKSMDSIEKVPSIKDIGASPPSFITPPLNPKEAECSKLAQEAINILLAKYPLTPENSWVKSEEVQDGVTIIHMKEDPVSHLVWLRSETTINAPAMEVCTLLHDLNIKSIYDELFDKGHTIEKFNDRLQVAYQRYKGKFPVSGRDFVLASTFITNENGWIIIGAKSIEHEKAPHAKGLVRAEIIAAGWILQPDPKDSNKTKAIYIAFNDLKGKIPQGLFKTACRSNAMAVHEFKKYVDKIKNKK